MSDQETKDQEAVTPSSETVPIERTNAYRAGYMAGYTADNPNSDPSVAGYFDGYFEQNEGNQSKDNSAE